MQTHCKYAFLPADMMMDLKVGDSQKRCNVSCAGGDVGHVQPVPRRHWAPGLLPMEGGHLRLHWPPLELPVGHKVTCLTLHTPFHQCISALFLSGIACVCVFLRKKTSTWWSTVAGCLSVGSPTFFRSGAQEFGEPGWWKLVQNRPPTLRPDVDKAVTKAKGKDLDSLRLELQLFCIHTYNLLCFNFYSFHGRNTIQAQIIFFLHPSLV